MSVEKAKEVLWTSLMHLQGDAMYSREEAVNAIESLVRAIVDERLSASGALCHAGHDWEYNYTTRRCKRCGVGGTAHD